MKIKIDVEDGINLENAIFAIYESLGDTDNLQGSSDYSFCIASSYVTEDFTIDFYKTKKNNFLIKVKNNEANQA